MKKSILFVALIGSVLFFSCSKDNDDKGICESCELIGVPITACDNGDGTVSISSGGNSETISEEELGGLSPEDYVKGICSAGDINLGQVH
ncbi:hypothetical protein H0I25_02310 [Cellulophaga sp. HaHa_2_95]|uniref:hypothetical protein n=1 Tax=unclassified Cellulophaga TaxID=2634405 RepID=UPI001C4FDC39|nr:MULTISPECIES: hypothetical protein [unclassified Cellulophaga]QXP51023.1 hypothetical protein H0I24_12810 [Cellulophaga sp. HaHa_2_1]QXP56648.1 hypothetical protein H0I25_02310 [Cellulophaga sp. HaHa_2_95]